MDLFEAQSRSQTPDHAPLSEKLRPKTWDDFLVVKNSIKPAVLELFKEGRFPSTIIYGPPGTGKTTLVRLFVKNFGQSVVELNAVDLTAKGLREECQKASERFVFYQKQTLMFIDEAHRLSKAQQDVLLPSIEKGDIIFVGATTENPRVVLNPALLSRCHLVQLKNHDENSLLALLKKSSDYLGFKAISDLFSQEAQLELIMRAQGDARTLINFVERIQLHLPNLEDPKLLPLSWDTIEKITGAEATKAYPKQGGQHFDLISAFIKSMRASKAEDAMYYFYRMIDLGEDPLYITRRMIIFASEDIGLADSNALTVALNSMEALKAVGLPEAIYNLTHGVMYLSQAAKSRTVVNALKLTKQNYDKNPQKAIPDSLRNL